MRALLLVPALLVAAPAYAEQTKSIPKSLATGTDVCKEIKTEGKCAAAGTLKTKTQGTATVYRVDGDQIRIALAIDTGKEIILQTVLEDMKSNCGAGKCTDLIKTTPRLREVKIAGTDAIAVELVTTYTHQLNDPPKPSAGSTKTTWQTLSLLACGKGSKGFLCVASSYGGRDNPCSAVLSKTGEVKYTCTQTEVLAF